VYRVAIVGKRGFGKRGTAPSRSIRSSAQVVKKQCNLEVGAASGIAAFTV